MYRYQFSAVLVGMLFAVGLMLGGMTNPAKVQAFLDLAGPWDPSLALVMAGAIAVGVVAFALARGRQRSLLGAPMRLPTKTDIDQPLVVGGLVFGAGWGLAGFCPGPALVAVGTGDMKAWVFFAAMLAGMGLFEWHSRRH